MATVPIATRPRPGTRRRRRGGAVLPIVLVVVVAGAVAGWAWWNGTIGSVPVRAHCTATASGTTTEVDPEQAGNAAIITAIAVRRGLPARAATIGLATAVQESKLRNIDYGDRDSLGLFQQRPSQGWGTEAQVRDPVYATNKFYDALIKIDGFETMAITEVAQKVQRSAFPSAYADHEPEGRVMASALSGYSPGGFTCVLRPVPSLPAESPAAGGLTPRARAVVAAGAAEAGRRNAVAASEDGRSVRWTVSGREDGRYAWSLAHWAVARADALHVVRVEVAGRQWRRDDSTAGWTARSGGALPPGQVLVHVA